MVRVHQHPRAVKIFTAPKLVYIDDQPYYRRGFTSETGDMDIYPGSIAAALRDLAKEHAIELKDSHIKDELIETLIHEYLHSTIRSEVTIHKGTVEEERIVEQIAAEAADKVRELPRLTKTGISTEATRKRFKNITSWKEVLNPP